MKKTKKRPFKESVMLKGKSIVLGVTGSIAAYKAVDITRQLMQLEANVDVIMTKGATQFITPLIFESITGKPVISNMFALGVKPGANHVSLANNADVIVVAPATANIISKLANGISDEIVSSTVLANKNPTIIAPAMNVNMFENPVTQENLSKLKNRGFIIVGPACGNLASGQIGLGRLASINDIIGSICQVLAIGGDLYNKRVTVTAGATQEPIDPVRYLTNHSSGKMGYALAEAARDRGAIVTLITAPTALTDVIGVEIIKIKTADEMYQATKGVISSTDVLIMAAAVSDYSPISKSAEKLKKRTAEYNLKLQRTIDILANVTGDFIKVGFAAESSNLLENAKNKMQQKKLDIIVANDITVEDSGFGSDKNCVTIINKNGQIDELTLLPKRIVADKILDQVVMKLTEKK
jgi:phosphopantothenoylcysteine decarboxylase / phosphopantothenate---cysteine ligase